MIQKLNKYTRAGMSRIKREHVKHNIKESVITILLFIFTASIIAFIISTYNRPRIITGNITSNYVSLYNKSNKYVTSYDSIRTLKYDTGIKTKSISYYKKTNKETSKEINEKKMPANKPVKSVKRMNSRTTKDTSSFKQSGVASHMGSALQGRIQANGEKHDKNKLICAHRTLPFGTVIKVTNKSNGKSVNVTVTDRGPYVSGRIVDLSLMAANKIGIKDAGVTNVEIVKIR